MYSKHSIFFKIDCYSSQKKTFFFVQNVNYIFRLKFVFCLHQRSILWSVCNKNNNMLLFWWKAIVLILDEFSVLNRSRANIHNKYFVCTFFFFSGLLNQLATNYVASFCVKPHRVLRLLCIPPHLLEVNSRRFEHTILLAVTRDYILYRKPLSTEDRCRSIRNKIRSQELHGCLVELRYGGSKRT